MYNFAKHCFPIVALLLVLSIYPPTLKALQGGDGRQSILIQVDPASERPSFSFEASGATSFGIVVSENAEVTLTSPEGSHLVASAYSVLPDACTGSYMLDTYISQTAPIERRSDDRLATRPLSVGAGEVVVIHNDDVSATTLDVQGEYAFNFVDQSISFQLLLFDRADVDLQFPSFREEVEFVLIANTDAQLIDVFFAADGPLVVSDGYTQPLEAFLEWSGQSRDSVFGFMNDNGVQIYPRAATEYSYGYRAEQVLRLRAQNASPNSCRFVVGDTVRAIEGAVVELRLEGNELVRAELRDETEAQIVEILEDGRLVVQRGNLDREIVINSWLLEVVQ